MVDGRFWSMLCTTHRETIQALEGHRLTAMPEATIEGGYYYFFYRTTSGVF